MDHDNIHYTPWPFLRTCQYGSTLPAQGEMTLFCATLPRRTRGDCTSRPLHIAQHTNTFSHSLVWKLRLLYRHAHTHARCARVLVETNVRVCVYVYECAPSFIATVMSAIWISKGGCCATLHNDRSSRGGHRCTCSVAGLNLYNSATRWHVRRNARGPCCQLFKS